MMARASSSVWLVLLVTVLHQVASAPVQDVQDAGSINKRRESTKETIELEETLKRLAGEDKKYFSNSMAMPMPQVDGLQDAEEGSGEEEEVEETGNPLEHPPAQVNPLEDQLLELPELEEDPSVRYPVPGPFGPGLQTSSNDGVEYEPSLPVEEEEDEEEEEEGEDYYLQRVMETLRRHPELLDEIMQEEALEAEGNHVEEEFARPTPAEDYEDRMEEIQAELDSIRAQEQKLGTIESGQQYMGDQEPHVVSKKRMYIPNEYVKDDLQTLNKYFDKFGEASQEDIPIM